MNFKLFRRIPVDPETRKKRRKFTGLAAVAGLLSGLAFPPVPGFPLIFFAIAPLLYILDSDEKLISKLRYTYLYGFIFSLVSLYWVSAVTELKDTFLLVGGGLLQFINPAFFLIPAALFHFARKKFGSLPALMLMPFFWFSYEYFYMETEANFPWLALANSVTYFKPFIQIADLIGGPGITVLIVYINAFVYLAFKNYTISRKNAVAYAAAPVLLILIPVIYGLSIDQTELTKGEKLRVGLIQPNLDPYDKWGGAELSSIVDEYMELSKKSAEKGAELLIYPETALPVYLLNGSYPAALDSFYSIARNNNVYLLTGMPDLRLHEPGEVVKGSRPVPNSKLRYSVYNSVLLFAPRDREIQRYGKIKLVPFGERVPYVEKLPFLSTFFSWSVGISSWNEGTDTTNFRLAPFRQFKDTVSISGIVCFESVFPVFMAEFALKGAQMFAVVTNDSWYGNTSGPYQHKEISVLRAIENRKYVVRAANGGISCIIDPYGNTLASSKMFERTEITGDVVLNREVTFYAGTARYLPAFSMTLSVFMVLLTFMIWLRSKLKI